jgi:hypothetical protein
MQQYATVYKEGAQPILGIGRPDAMDRTASTSDYTVFTATTDDSDRDGDTVLPMGWNGEHYKRNPVWTFGHQEWKLGIGTSMSPDGRLCCFPEENRMQQWLWWDKLDQDAMWLKSKYDRKQMHSVSIAFVPIKAFRKDEMRKAHQDESNPSGWIFAEWDHTETSCVLVPANPFANAQHKWYKSAPSEFRKFYDECRAETCRVRDWVDKEGKDLSPQMRKCLRECYAAKSVNESGGCFTGWCPRPDGTCAPCEKGGKTGRDSKKVVFTIREDRLPELHADGGTTYTGTKLGNGLMRVALNGRDQIELNRLKDKYAEKSLPPSSPARLAGTRVSKAAREKGGSPDNAIAKLVVELNRGYWNNAKVEELQGRTVVLSDSSGKIFEMELPDSVRYNNSTRRYELKSTRKSCPCAACHDGKPCGCEGKALKGSLIGKAVEKSSLDKWFAIVYSSRDGKEKFVSTVQRRDAGEALAWGRQKWGSQFVRVDGPFDSAQDARQVSTKQLIGRRRKAVSKSFDQWLEAALMIAGFAGGTAVASAAMSLGSAAMNKLEDWWHSGKTPEQAAREIPKMPKKSVRKIASKLKPAFQLLRDAERIARDAGFKYSADAISSAARAVADTHDPRPGMQIPFAEDDAVEKDVLKALLEYRVTMKDGTSWTVRINGVGNTSDKEEAMARASKAARDKGKRGDAAMADKTERVKSFSKAAPKDSKGRPIRSGDRVILSNGKEGVVQHADTATGISVQVRDGVTLVTGTAGDTLTIKSFRAKDIAPRYHNGADISPGDLVTAGNVEGVVVAVDSRRGSVRVRRSSGGENDWDIAQVRLWKGAGMGVCKAGGFYTPAQFFDSQLGQNGKADVLRAAGMTQGEGEIASAYARGVSFSALSPKMQIAVTQVLENTPMYVSYLKSLSESSGPAGGYAVPPEQVGKAPEVSNTLPLKIKETANGRFNVYTGNNTLLNSRPFDTREEAQTFLNKESSRYAGKSLSLRCSFCKGTGNGCGCKGDCPECGGGGAVKSKSHGIRVGDRVLVGGKPGLVKSIDAGRKQAVLKMGDRLVRWTFAALRAKGVRKAVEKGQFDVGQNATFYLQGYKTNIQAGGTYKIPYGQFGTFRVKVISVDLKDAKMRNASGSHLAMPQTVVVGTILPAKETKALKTKLQPA